MTCSPAPRRAQRAKGKPWSFLHISKPEIDLDPGIDPYDRAVYAKAAENLHRMIKAGVLMRDATEFYYVYRLTWRDRVQTGLAAAASVADYDTNRIRKHELTTPVKEDDRVRQIEAVNAQTGPVMIAYPPAPKIDAMLAEPRSAPPRVDVTADDGVRHQMWVVDDEATITALTRAFDALPAIYIADGHHRSAAAARVADAARRQHRLARLFPVGDLPASPDDDPRLQPRHPRSQRPQRRADCSPRLRERFTVARVRPAGAARLHRASSACISPAAGTG